MMTASRLLLLLLGTFNPVTAVNWKSWPKSVYIQTRRRLNLSSTFGSATKAEPYDRITGHPVFSITTPWGSPYMNMEKLSDLDEQVQSGTSDSQLQSLSEEQNEYRSVALFFMDPDDAIAVHGEMKQMENLRQADIRITSMSLAKAIRQSSNLGNGLVTGLPPDRLDGKLKADEGALLRYKIVPPKRQLYYAARCTGKERVGLFGETPEQDAQTAVMGNSALESMNLQRRRERRERKTPRSSRTPMQQANAHMEGYCGIPVFYSHQMRQSVPLLKRLAAPKHSIPLFFNYEDLQLAWTKMRKRNPKKKIPMEPPAVEVFNLMDVLTSMEREQWAKKQNSPSWKDPLGSLKTILSQKEGLEAITFVPSSRSVEYKEAISARGNGKARLRPMR